MLRPLRAALLAALLAAPSIAQTVFVDASATGAADGSSWADAYPDLQPALLAAPVGAEVWVAAGTYRPGTERGDSFRLRSGVALYGGFAGVESTRDERDWEANETVLSGDIGVAGDLEDNAYHVVDGSRTDGTAVLDGFTVTAGAATGPFPRNRGAGMRTAGGSPTVRHVTFMGNVARATSTRAGFGGGVLNDSSSAPTFVDVRFIENRAEGGSGGAGMANKLSSDPLLVRVVFERNAAGLLGGGMTNDTGSSPTLVDVTFRENAARFTGGMDNYQDADAVLWNVTFEGNTAEEYGGGMTNDAGSDAHLYNVLFVGNRSENETLPGGAALHNDASDPVLVGVTFAGNEAANGAGAVFSTPNASPVIRNAVLWGNGTEIAGPAAVSHAVVEGGFAGTAVQDADPLFVAAPSPGAYGDLRLQPGSPALDAGDPSALPADEQDLDGDGDVAEPLPLDLGGADREQGGVDLGAYEGAVSVSVEGASADGPLRLARPFPNPASGSVQIRYAVDAAGPHRLTLIDALGRAVRVLAAADVAPGERVVGVDTAGLAPGLYLVRLEHAGRAAVQPLRVVR